MISTDFKKIPISEATKIPDMGGEYTLIKNMWWFVTEDDCILYYRGYSRQCNADKTIANSFLEIPTHPAKKIVFLENVWEPFRRIM